MYFCSGKTLVKFCVNLKPRRKITPPRLCSRLIYSLLRGLLYAPTNNILIQLFRYFFVGGTAFIVDFGLLAALTEFGGMPYQLSACVGFIGGLIVNYLLSIIWVFGSDAHTRGRRMAEFLAFALIGVIGLGLNALIMWIFTEVVMLHYLISKIISTIVVFAWNFLARRSLINQFNLSAWKAKLSGNK